jgi:hypothetical protein
MLLRFDLTMLRNIPSAPSQYSVEKQYEMLMDFITIAGRSETSYYRLGRFLPSLFEEQFKKNVEYVKKEIPNFIRTVIKEKLLHEPEKLILFAYTLLKYHCSLDKSGEFFGINEEISCIDSLLGDDDRKKDLSLFKEIPIYFLSQGTSLDSFNQIIQNDRQLNQFKPELERVYAILNEKDIYQYER